MRISLGWLKEFIDIITITPDSISDRLTMIGLEVEGMERLDDDIIFEVNVTPNRPDCLSILGVARELSAAFSIPLRLPDYKINEEGSDGGFKVEILDSDLCRRYAGRVVKGVKVSHSPEWLKDRLHKCGIRAINNVVDITNYVQLELGHPLHAFDLNTLKGNMIKVSRAGEDADIVTLDGVERELQPEALLICDAKNPVAVAGVMGGSDTQVTDSTTDIFIESAYFEPTSVRRTSKALGLKTESSYRFERGADIEFLSTALDRAAFLIQQIAGGNVYRKIDVYPGKFVQVPINVRCNRVNKVLGTDIADSEMIGILRGLGIGVEEKNNSFVASPPSFRVDLRMEADIIEEIARIYGYQKIKTTIPRAAISANNSDRKRGLISRIKDTVRRAGFNEAINYSFMNENNLDALNVPQGDRRRRVIPIKNPLRAEEALLRTILLPSLIDDFMHNFARGVRDIKLFEAAKVFEEMGRPLPLEITCMGGIFYRGTMPSLWKESAGSFYIVKGVIESVMEDLHIKKYSFYPSKETFLHAGQSCEIRVSGAPVGFLGALSPVIVDKMDLKVSKPEIIVFEMDIDKLVTLVPVTLEYSSIPKFPFVERDIAIVVDDKFASAEIQNLIRAYPSEFIEDVAIFDLYKGGNIQAGKKSLAFTVRYRSRHRTMTEAEVEDLHENIVKYLKAETGGELRV